MQSTHEVDTRKTTTKESSHHASCGNTLSPTKHSIHEADPRMTLSSKLSIFMDNIGYERNRIEIRAGDYFPNEDKEFKAVFQVSGNYFIFNKMHRVGSAGEGIAMVFEPKSDEDVFFTDERNWANYAEAIPAAPGYVYLKKSGTPKTQSDTEGYICFNPPEDWISNQSKFYSAAKTRRQGPSWPLGNQEESDDQDTPIANVKHECDRVFGIHFEFTALIKDWCKRSRLSGSSMTSLDEDKEDRMHNWPGDEKILELSKLPTYLVPVGEKGSKHYEYQWRVSFVLHENFLVKSLNDTQMKVFILLRKIAKNYLKPVCDDFISYMMKNVAFWYFEQHYLEEFVQEHLLDRLAGCLKLLRTFLERQRLPSYMLPEKDLLNGKLCSETDVATLLQTVTQLLSKLDEHATSVVESPSSVMVPIFCETKESLNILKLLDDIVTSFWVGE